METFIKGEILGVSQQTPLEQHTMIIQSEYTEYFINHSHDARSTQSIVFNILCNHGNWYREGSENVNRATAPTVNFPIGKKCSRDRFPKAEEARALDQIFVYFLVAVWLFMVFMVVFRFALLNTVQAPDEV